MASSTPKDTGSIQHLWLSPWTRWVGTRYLKSKKNSKFLSFITLLSVCGVGLGVTAMIVVLSVMDGFEAELKKRLTASDLHILITPTKSVEGFEAGFVSKKSLNPEELKSRLRLKDEVLSIWPMVTTEAILKIGRKVTGVVVKGINEERLNILKKQITEFADAQTLKQMADDNAVRLSSVYIGQELAYEMGMIPGDQLTLISPTETDGPMNAVPRMKRFVIEGIYKSGLPEQELHTVFCTDQSVRSFLKKTDVLTQWEISVKEFDRAPMVAQEVSALLPHFRVQDWNQMNAHLFASLKLERTAMFVILAFIVVVASFNIVTTLTLMVIEKKKEISILKAMGARRGQVAAVFLWEGLLIGLVGIVGGAGLGFFLCSLLRRYEFIQLPEIYYDRTLPVTFNYWYYLLIGFSALIIVLVACRYPSYRAAKLHPLEGIRFGK